MKWKNTNRQKKTDTSQKVSKSRYLGMGFRMYYFRCENPKTKKGKCTRSFKSNSPLFTGGYSFIEVLVAVAIFSFVLTITTTIMVNSYNAQKKERIRNMLIEETQFLVNRLSNTIRNNTIDFAEYYAQSRKGNNWIDIDPNYLYGKYPKEYEWHFYYVEECDIDDTPYTDDLDFDYCTRENPNNFNEGYFDTYSDNSQGEGTGNDDSSKTALDTFPIAGILNPHEQRELYLISSDGLTKTILRRMDNGVDDDLDGTADEDSQSDALGNVYWTPGLASDGVTPFTDGGERLGILELVAQSDYYSIADDDGTPSTPAADPDGILDFEGDPDDFQVYNQDIINGDDFIPISPIGIDITNLQFFITPLDDPRKAFSETSADMQIQPQVTILITTRPSQRFLRQLPGDPFDISIQTTVVSRTLSNVLFPDP
jgi:type II secretory pathway pseudopilin PulG